MRNPPRDPPMNFSKSNLNSYISAIYLLKVYKLLFFLKPIASVKNKK
nr:MAG TPA: hypothetical protein [Caudoviricetes sp.]